MAVRRVLRLRWLRENRTWRLTLFMSILALAGRGSAAVPDDRADPRAFALPETAREVVGQRTARTKRFRLPGAGRFAEVATGRALHYRDAAGAWRPSRAELRSRDKNRTLGVVKPRLVHGNGVHGPVRAGDGQ